MKIAVWHNLPSGGGKRALYDHVKGLVERGHTVEAWCPPTADQTYLPLSDLVQEHVIPLRQPKPKSVFRRAFTSHRHLIGRRLSRLEAARDTYEATVDGLRAMEEHCQHCAEEINAGGFDLLFANGCLFYRMTPIGRYAKIPAVIYLQEPFRDLYEAAPELPWLAIPAPQNAARSPRFWKQYVDNIVGSQALRVQAREELRSAKSYQRIFVNSYFSRESVLRAYGLDATVCYLGVDHEMFSNRHLPREDFLVGLGSFTLAKNIALVIEAVALLPNPRPRLVWVGNTASGYLDAMISLARDRDVCFEPLVRITDEHLVDLLNRASMMVYAPRLEPFGYAPLEANSCGVPVIAVAEGGVRETVVNDMNGLLVEHNPKAVADAIQTLRRDVSYARRLGQQGTQLVAERWSLRASIDRLEVRFEEVLKERHCSAA